MSGNGDYISREAAIESMYKDAEAHQDHTFWTTQYEALLNIPAADVRPVVTCADCKWWTKQEASLQGRCKLLQIYPTGAWFCANGKREES